MNPTSPIATACAASSRYAAPSLRYGPSGDPTQPAATGFGMAGSALPAINDRRLTGSARPFTPRLNRHKGNQRSSAGCRYPNSRVSSAAFIYNNPTTPYSCCQVVQRMGSTSLPATIMQTCSTTTPNAHPRTLGVRLIWVELSDAYKADRIETVTLFQDLVFRVVWIREEKRPIEIRLPHTPQLPRLGTA